MVQNNTDRVPDTGRGPETGPLPPIDSSQGAPTTYVPPQQPSYSPGQAGYAPHQPSSFGQPYQPAGANPTPAQQSYYMPHQGRRHGRHRVPTLGPLFLILIGSVFLLNNLGIVDWDVWESLSRLWPLVLIAVGVDILFGRRRPFLSMLVVLAALAVGAGYLYSSGGLRGGGRVLSTPLRVPVGGANSADVTLSMGTGDLSVSGTAPGETNMAAGTIQYREGSSPPLVKESLRGDVAYLRVEQQGSNFSFIPFLNKSSLTWNVTLARSIPLSLDVETGAGKVSLDLSGFKLSKLRLNAGAGDTFVAFPATGVQNSASINGGAGNLSIVVPNSLKARIKVDHGFGNLSADPRFLSSEKGIYVTKDYPSGGAGLDLTVNAGVGNIDIMAPQGQP